MRSALGMYVLTVVTLGFFYGRMVVNKEEKWFRVFVLKYGKALDIKDKKELIKNLILLQLLKNKPKWI